MKVWQKFLIVVLIVLVVLGALKNIIIQAGITTFGSKIVGAKIHLQHFALSLITQKVDMKGLKVYNPPGFPNEPFVDIPEIRIDADVMAFLKGKIHLRYAVFNMKEMVVVRNKDGKLNVDSLKVIEDQKKAAEEAKKKNEPKKPMPEYAIQIDELKLNVDRVIMKDYSKGGEPVISVFDVALKDKTFKNVDSVQKLITLVLVNAMGPTAIQSAGMYAAATILGVGFLPAGIVGAIVAKDDSTAEFKQSVPMVYESALKLIKEHGEVTYEDKKTGIIKAKENGVDLTIKVEKNEKGKTTANVTARKMMLPKPDIAGGIIYRLKERLK